MFAVIFWQAICDYRGGVKPDQRLHLLHLETNPYVITSSASAYSSPYPPPPPPYQNARSLRRRSHNLDIIDRDLFCFVLFCSFFTQDSLFLGVVHTYVHWFDRDNIAIDSFPSL